VLDAKGYVADGLQTVMVLKYLIKDYPITTLYFGIANVVANGLVMLRYVYLSDELRTGWILLLMHFIARLSSGSRRTLKMTTPTTLHCDSGS
jgi:hypothetical protein